MELHAIASYGPDVWDSYCAKMQDLYLAEFMAVRDRMHISMASDYDAMTAEDRSAFAYTLEDYIRRGIPTAKKKGRKR